jgi:hypothetical protein
MTSATTVLDGYPLVALLRDLGFSVPRRGNRTKCLIHGGDGNSFSFDSGKGVWCCHACGASGGKLDLVASVLKVDRRDALRWMADRQGIVLDSWTPEQHRDYQTRLRSAETEAQALVDWRNGLLDVLRDRRDELMTTYYEARRVLVAREAQDGSALYECACLVDATWWRKVEEMDRGLDLIRGASFSSVLPFFRRRQSRSKA